MTFATFFMAIVLSVVAWMRAVVAIARYRPVRATLCLLCPPLIAWAASRDRLDLTFERVLLETALICLLPSVLYFSMPYLRAILH